VVAHFLQKKNYHMQKLWTIVFIVLSTCSLVCSNLTNKTTHKIFITPFLILKLLWHSWNNVVVPSGAVGKDCQRRLLSQPRFVRAVAPRIIIIIYWLRNINPANLKPHFFIPPFSLLAWKFFLSWEHNITMQFLSIGFHNWSSIYHFGFWG
jgi:hypothetical protein